MRLVYRYARLNIYVHRRSYTLIITTNRYVFVQIKEKETNEQDVLSAVSVSFLERVTEINRNLVYSLCALVLIIIISLESLKCSNSNQNELCNPYETNECVEMKCLLCV